MRPREKAWWEEEKCNGGNYFSKQRKEKEKVEEESKGGFSSSGRPYLDIFSQPALWLNVFAITRIFHSLVTTLIINVDQFSFRLIVPLLQSGTCSSDLFAAITSRRSLSYAQYEAGMVFFPFPSYLVRHAQSMFYSTHVTFPGHLAIQPHTSSSLPGHLFLTHTVHMLDVVTLYASNLVESATRY